MLDSRARGDVAQLEEHCVRIAGVRGSSPLISTNVPVARFDDPRDGAWDTVEHAITDHRSPGADAVIAYAPVMGRRTIYARIGDAFGWLSSAATGASAGWGLLSAVGIV